MRSRVLGILTLFSLVLFVAVVGMWVGSYWFCGFVHHETGMMGEGDAKRARYHSVYSYRGGVLYSRLKAVAKRGPILDNTPVGWGGGWTVPADEAIVSRGSTWGFRFLSEHRPISGNMYHHLAVVAFPYWVAALLLAVLPACCMIGRVRRRRRGAAGLCVACGYDLRATAGRCPECGASPAGHR